MDKDTGSDGKFINAVWDRKLGRELVCYNLVSTMCSEPSTLHKVAHLLLYPEAGLYYAILTKKPEIHRDQGSCLNSKQVAKLRAKPALLHSLECSLVPRVLCLSSISKD